MEYKVADLNTDKEALLGVFIEAASNLPYGGYEFEVEGLSKAVDLYTTGDGYDQRICILAMDGDTIAGFILGASGTHAAVFQTKKVAYELSWWVAPKYRNTKVSLRLLDLFEDWAKYINADFSIVSSQANEYEERLNKLYTKRGFVKSEVSYFKKMR